MTVPTQIPLAERPRGAPAARPAPGDLLPLPTVGSFFAEGRALADARRPHLARVGMTPEHAEALRMPDLSERPLVAPVRTEDLPEQAPPAYEPRRLPRLPGVNVALHEE